MFGKLFADKGYISDQLTKILFVSDIHLVTSIRNNIKNSLMTMNGKRHRSFVNFVSNMIAGLIAYSFFPKKPSIAYQTLPSNQICAF